MKNILLSIFITAAFAACSNNNKQDEPVLKDPTQTQPVSDALPDSMKLQNDSVISPDLTPGNGSQTGRGDSAARKQK